MTYAAQELSANDGSKVELYLFDTEDGLYKWAFTTDRKPINALSTTFVPTPIKRSKIRQNAGETGGERISVTVPYDNPVAVLHVPYLPPSPIRVRIYSYHRTDGTLELKLGFIGFVSGFSQRGPEAVLSCSQVIDTLNQTVPWAVFQETCIWSTYEEGCGVPRSLFATGGQVIAIDGDTVDAVEFDTKPDGWFTAGYVLNQSTGEARFITAHTGLRLTLSFPFTGLDLGDTLVAYAGDDKQPETCRIKFNNKINYVGFDFQPNYNVFAKGTG